MKGYKYSSIPCSDTSPLEQNPGDAFTPKRLVSFILLHGDATSGKKKKKMDKLHIVLFLTCIFIHTTLTANVLWSIEISGGRGQGLDGHCLLFVGSGLGGNPDPCLC